MIIAIIRLKGMLSIFRMMFIAIHFSGYILNKSTLDNKNDEVIKMRKFLLLWIMFLFTAENIIAGDSSPVKVIGATTAQTMTAKMYKDKGFTFVDVRSESDYNKGHIVGAKNLDVEQNFTEESLSKLAKKNEPVVFYCTGVTCMRSSIATQKALDWGWTKVFYYRAGYNEWKMSGLEVE